MQSVGDVQIARSVSGVGVNGVSVCSLHFKSTDTAISMASLAAPVVVSGIGNLPTFYIDKRTYNDGIWTVECVDKCACLDKPIKGLVPSDGKYLMSAVFDKMEVDCGCTVNAPSGLPTYIAQEKIDGKNYQSVLQSISEALCGFWCCHYTDVIELLTYSQQQSAETITDHSKVHENGVFEYASVNVSDGKSEQSFGSGEPALNISNDFVDTSNSTLYNGVVGTSFYGWSVDKAIIPSANMPLLGGSLTMRSTNYRVTSVRGRIVGDKLMVSASGDIPQYGEINRRGLLQQRLDNAVSTDRTYGTIKPTNDKDLGFVAQPNQTGA